MLTVTVVSAHTDKKEKEWRENDLSGFYHMVEIVNDRPVYKVSFLLQKSLTLATKGLLLLNFSETKKLKAVKRYIFGIKEK